MSEGYRDAFVENDNSVIGNYDTGTNLLVSGSSVRRRKKVKKHRKVSYRRKRRLKRHITFHRRRKRGKVSKMHGRKKRRGMSAGFLKNLRRKHGLGEFKKR